MKYAMNKNKINANDYTKLYRFMQRVSKKLACRLRRTGALVITDSPFAALKAREIQVQTGDVDMSLITSNKPDKFEQLQILT